LKSGLWVRLARFAIRAPDRRHHRRFQAEIPLMPVSEFGQPPLIKASILSQSLKSLWLLSIGLEECQRFG
jgi:hypothetical protein